MVSIPEVNGMIQLESIPNCTRVSVVKKNPVMVRQLTSTYDAPKFAAAMNDWSWISHAQANVNPAVSYLNSILSQLKRLSTCKVLTET